MSDSRKELLSTSEEYAKKLVNSIDKLKTAEADGLNQVLRGLTLLTDCLLVTEAVSFRKLQVFIPDSPTIISAPMTTYMDVFSMRMLFGPSYFPNDIDMNISTVWKITPQTNGHYYMESYITPGASTMIFVGQNKDSYWRFTFNKTNTPTPIQLNSQGDNTEMVVTVGSTTCYLVPISVVLSAGDANSGSISATQIVACTKDEVKDGNTFLWYLENVTNRVVGDPILD